MKKNTLLILLAGLFLMTCFCIALIGGGAWWLFSNAPLEAFTLPEPDRDLRLTAEARLTQTPIQANKPPADTGQTVPTAQPAANTELPAQPTPAPEILLAQQANLDTIVNAVLPREDLAELAVRFKGVKPNETKIVCESEASGYDPGQKRKFTLSNQDDNTQFEIDAELIYETEHVYMWVQAAPLKLNISASRLKRAADQFESEIYPKTREFFGSEETPGVDCDKHLHIIHASGIGSSVGGYFSSPDSYPRAVRSDSNEGQVFVVHAAPGFNGSDPGSGTYMSTLAHEFQHMISFGNAHASDLWLEEGAAQFAERLNGYGAQIGTIYDFAAKPETQLNTWEESSAGANGAHYGGGYLFWSYMYDRFGGDIVKKLARSKERSEQAFIEILAENSISNSDTNKPYTFDELFADFVVANYLNKSKIESSGNRFNYETINVPPMTERASYTEGDLPLDTKEVLSQFGTDYIRLEMNRPTTIEFLGDAKIDLLPMSNSSPAGKFWWSNRSDVSNPRLTRAVDLSNIQRATLNFRAWYRLEKDYDYAYISASEDGGATWQVVKTKTCTTDNPQNANLGCGWNGASGTQQKNGEPRWIDEQADLSAYAGKNILVRFEMVTDAGVNREGIAIDNIEIPELGIKDDSENDGDWKAEGWVRIDNTLPQNWRVSLILTLLDDSRVVERMTITNGIGSAQINFGDRVKRVVMAISPTTQVTTEPASYRLRLK